MARVAGSPREGFVGSEHTRPLRSVPQRWRGSGVQGTLLDPVFRQARQVALAEHFHYPHAAGILARYRLNQVAVVTRDWKVAARGGEIDRFDLSRDRAELRPIPSSVGEALEACRLEGLSGAVISKAAAHLRGFERFAQAA